MSTPTTSRPQSGNAAMSDTSQGDSDSAVWTGAAGGGGQRGPMSSTEPASLALAAASATEATATNTTTAEEGDQEKTKCTKTATGWLVTSCDVGTAEPQSLSEELDRLQVLKSYHLMDHERDESVDRLTRMAGLVLDTPYTCLSLVDMGRIWFRWNPDSACEQQLTRDMLSCLSRVIMKHNTVFDVPDITQDEMFQKAMASEGNAVSNNDTDASSSTSSNIARFRCFAGAPLVSPEGYRLGAFCMLDTRPRSTTAAEKENLLDFARIMVKEMVDRRKLTTQGSPSHLVACTAHDLITPLTGIQLSLSLLQQDVDFQEKLGEKRTQYTNAAVRSSNMMLRICQSTIETLRGNRKIPSSSSSDWALPRNIMHIAEASPFIDMKEFTSNLEAISNSIPKQVPLTITLHHSAPTNIVTDGLKIFRSALNLLSNACTRASTGYISMTIFDDDDGSLIFECEDTGKAVDIRDGHSLFSQDIDTSNFGLYSVAYQINWLGGKYGVRKRDTATTKWQTPASINGTSVASSTTVPPNASVANDEKCDEKGAIFWFSIPIVLPQDVSELVGLAKSLSGDGSDVAGIPTFKADLPATPPASPIIEENTEAKGSPISAPNENAKRFDTTRSLNALIIEDSTTVRKILGRALSKLGYQVFEAADGMEGLRELKATMFDLVLCDFLMPVMDGLDCVQQFREWEVKNRTSFRQYIIGISAHASRNDIERGLKLGMDDFKPKPIVLKTLTMLHESAALKAVRASLDNLLNFPPSEETSQGSIKGDNLRFSDPDEKREPKISTHFTIPIASIAPADSPGLFVIPMNPSRMEVSTEDGNNRALFAIPAKPSAATASALFSLGSGESSLPNNFEQQVNADSSQKGGPFTVSTHSIEADASNYDNGKKNLFSIPCNPSKATQKPTSLFSNPVNPNTPDTSSQQGPAKKPAPLFSIPVNPTAGDETKSGSEQKPAPLFSILVNPKRIDETKQASKPAPLFSLPINTTTFDEREQGNITGQAPLFSRPIIPTPARETKPGTARDTGSLVSLLPPNPIQSEMKPDSESKKRPLFSLSNHISETSYANKLSDPISNFHRKEESPPLASLPANDDVAEPSDDALSSTPVNPSTSTTRPWKKAR